MSLIESTIADAYYTVQYHVTHLFNVVLHWLSPVESKDGSRGIEPYNDR